jgi:hypothetical protein
VRFDTKLVVVLRDDLAVWQTNVTAFLVSGIAGTVPGVVWRESMSAASRRAACSPARRTAR